MFKFADAILLSLLLAGSTAWAADKEKPLILKIGTHTVTAEVVATVDTRMRGLMFREKLGKNDGMLFVFDQLGYHGMWMKNTLIPLSVAFLDEQGRILNVAEMEPHSEFHHTAAGPARFALEMNAGWFAARKILPGTIVKGLEKAPKGQ